MATDTVELDPKDAYSTLYDGMKEVRTTFSSFNRLAQQVDRLGGGRSELRRLQRLIKRINNSLRYLVVFADDHQLLKEDMYAERLQEMVDAMKRRQVQLWTFGVKRWNVAHFSEAYWRMLDKAIVLGV